MTAIGLCGRRARGARLQLAGPPQQGDDGGGAPLRRRPARRADGCAHRHGAGGALQPAEETAMAMNVGSSGRRRGRSRLHDQHHAAGGRDAGAADHLPDHDPGGDADDPGGAAEGDQHRAPDQAGEHRHLGQQGRRHLLERAAGARHRSAVPAPEQDRGDERRSPRCTSAATSRRATNRSAACSSSATRAAIQKVSFVTEPPPKG